MRIVLSEPVTLGERTITEINTHPPVLGDLCAVGATPLGSAVADRKLLSSLTGESELLLDKIPARDWARISHELGKIWDEYFHPNEQSEGESKPEKAPANG